MANLKLDQELLIHQIGKEGDQAIAGIRRAVADARDEVAEIGAIIPDLAGRSATDLMMKARVAIGKDIEFKQENQRPQVRIEINGYGGYSFYQTVDDTIPAGRYRALFFLVPIKDETP